MTFTEDEVRNAVTVSRFGQSNPIKHELNVVYQLLLDAKKHKLRIADVMAALQVAIYVQIKSYKHFIHFV